MRDENSTKWSQGLLHVQWGMNTTFSKATKLTPYQTLFGLKPKVGLRTNLAIEFLENIESGIEEEEFVEIFEKEKRL